MNTAKANQKQSFSLLRAKKACFKNSRATSLTAIQTGKEIKSKLLQSLKSKLKSNSKIIFKSSANNRDKLNKGHVESQIIGDNRCSSRIDFGKHESGKPSK